MVYYVFFMNVMEFSIFIDCNLVVVFYNFQGVYVEFVVSIFSECYLEVGCLNFQGIDYSEVVFERLLQ